MKDIIAKSDGTSLIQHSKLVSKIAVEMAKQSMLDCDGNSDLIEAIRLGGLLHDIGKCQAKFQQMLFKISDEENVECKLPYRHNEVGWAFLNKNLNLKQSILNIVLDVVYWHHGISNNMASYNNTDIKISDKDNTAMLDYLKLIVESTHIIEKPYKPKKSPTYYADNSIDDADYINAEKTFARMAIISADRLASSLTQINLSDQEITLLVSKSTLRLKQFDYSNHIYSENERFVQQKNIITQIDRTTILKAPAGFGKTLTGLLWSFSRDKKLIWVCPRNAVAESVYKSILEELDNFKIHNLSVELFLANEVVEHNKNFIEKFSSDIIVTNIDNYSIPSVDNRNANRLHTIINSDVIFDEFHELISEGPLYACFINLMKVRHQLTNSHTLLLSATPTNMHILWDYDNQTKILPGTDKHYSAPHTKKYKILTSRQSKIKIKNANENNLIFVNSITNSQIYKRQLNAEILIHSNFIDEHRKAIMDKIYHNYGKKSERLLGKPNIVATHILQASLDISLCHLYESVLSPESTLQRIGRCDRWGDYNVQSTINIFNIQNNRSEDKIKDILYTNNLSNVWFDFIEVYNGQELSLDEFYTIYNNFNIKNAIVLEKYLKDKYAESLNRLSTIYPVKFFNKKKDDVLTAGGNKLRSSNTETFVIVKLHNENNYTSPFSVQIYGGFENTFNESGNIHGRLLKTMKHLRNINDTRFDYNNLLNNKKITLDKIRKFGKKSNTPYIRYDKVYHQEYGVISEENLNALI